MPRKKYKYPKIPNRCHTTRKELYEIKKIKKKIIY